MDLQLNIALSTLSLPPNERPANSIESVGAWLREKSKIFKQLDDAILSDVAKNCSLQMFSANHVLIRQGEIGDCFYIVLQGQVSIYICTDLEPGKVVGLGADDSSSSSTSKKAAKQDSDAGKEPKLERGVFGKHIVQVGMGASFGELALINDDCIRNASIITDDICHLICIDRALYNRSLKGFQVRDFQERNNFVESHPIFANWPWRLKRQAAMSLERTSFDFDSLITKQGKQAVAVYFILRGTARLIHSASLMNTSTGGKVPKPSIHYKTENSSKLSSKMTSVQRRPRSDSLDASNKSIRRHVELCMITNGEAIGDLEMLYPIEYYLFTTTAAAPTEVLSMSQMNISRFLENKTIAKLQVDLLAHAYYRLVDRVQRVTADCFLLMGMFENVGQIVSFAEAKRADLQRRRAASKKDAVNSNSKSATASSSSSSSSSLLKPSAAAKSSNSSRMSTPVAPPSNAFRRFITRDDDVEDTTLHYLPQDADGEEEVPADAKVRVFPDWETSDECLSALEQRIRKFNFDVLEGGEASTTANVIGSLPINNNSDDHRNSRHNPHHRLAFKAANANASGGGAVVEMRRYTVSGLQGAPRPGTLVKLRTSTSIDKSSSGGDKAPATPPSPISGNNSGGVSPTHRGGGSRAVTFSRELPIEEEMDSSRKRTFSLSTQRKFS